MDLISSDYFSRHEPGIFAPLYDTLLTQGDRYRHLADLTGSPVIELNRAVAVSFAASPAHGLTLLEVIGREGALAQYAPFHLARADMFRRLDRRDEAHRCYRAALRCAPNELVRRFIERRLQGGER